MLAKNIMGVWVSSSFIILTWLCYQNLLRGLLLMITLFRLNFLSINMYEQIIFFDEPLFISSWVWKGIQEGKIANCKTCKFHSGKWLEN